MLTSQASSHAGFSGIVFILTSQIPSFADFQGTVIPVFSMVNN